MRPYLWDPWKTADRFPHRPAVVVTDSEEAFTFRELTERADAMARGLKRAGVAEGAIVATDIPTGPRFFALALAGLRHGYGVFPVGAHHFATPTADALLTGTAAAVLVTDGARSLGPLPCPVVGDDELAAAVEPPPAAPGSARRPRAGYLVFATSGTTGVPQAVLRPRPPRPYKGVAVAERYGAGTDRGAHVMANPTYHLGTLGPALYALQAGSAVVVQRDWSPAGFFAAVDRYEADSAMLSPDRLLELVEDGKAPHHPLRVVFHGGSACPPAVKRSAIDLLGPVLHEYYGTSRGTLTEIGSEDWLDRPGSVGRPLPGIGIEIARDGHAVPAGAVGEIRVSLRGADRGDDEERFMDTGDIGFMDADGFLTVVGRADVSGDPDQARLEFEIRLIPGVTDVAVVGADLTCHVEVSRHCPADVTPAVQAAAQRLGLTLRGVVTGPTGSLPRTPSGKIARAALAAAPAHADTGR
ncbi:class I adenylate-forming enzyme family protein [Streptomyces sp. NPDC059467]|uniref:class I adenylate-forming enzyme family protein n=1 Tax=Streptomyces sp. NPDC059467 TaxID=3346844 RepID=UPI0036AA32CA